ncbi:MAG: hypothetical protein WAJ91_12060, partial [Rhodoplanes sp.]
MGDEAINNHRRAEFTSLMKEQREKKAMKILIAASLTIGTMFALVDPVSAAIVCEPNCKVCSAFADGNYRDSMV